MINSKIYTMHYTHSFTSSISSGNTWKYMGQCISVMDSVNNISRSMSPQHQPESFRPAWGNSTPIEVRRAGASAYRNSDKLQLLFEQWTSCEGHWQHSDFMIECKKKTKHRSYGSRVWMTRSEIANKFGSMVVAKTIIQSKEEDNEASVHQIRPHPDCHGKDTPDSYIVFGYVLPFIHCFKRWWSL